MVKTGQFTTKCNFDIFIAVKMIKIKIGLKYLIVLIMMLIECGII